MPKKEIYFQSGIIKTVFAVFVIMFLWENVNGFFEKRHKMPKRHLPGEDSLGDSASNAYTQKAILDVAYFLRRHKFNGRDTRYPNNTKNSFSFHKQFPDPPLRTVHWQVRRHCEESFLGCLRYLEDSFIQAGFSLGRLSNPFYGKDLTGYSQNQINELNKDCLKLLDKDNENYEIFRNHIDKFQWLASSSYFMCWYTLKKYPELKQFLQRCDNFGSCLDNGNSFSNEDIRANDEEPFACALYSFCPDPCCANRLQKSSEDCLQPACNENEPCSINFNENLDWDAMVQNHWNVTCNCPETGMRWSSQSGLCVDIDECLEGTDKCDSTTETCINIPGSYECVCGYLYEKTEEKSCEKNSFLESILFNTHNERENKEENSFMKWFGF